MWSQVSTYLNVVSAFRLFVIPSQNLSYTLNSYRHANYIVGVEVPSMQDYLYFYYESGKGWNEWRHWSYKWVGARKLAYYGLCAKLLFSTKNTKNNLKCRNVLA